MAQQWFMLKNLYSQLALAVWGDLRDPGTTVTMWYRFDNQKFEHMVWKFDGNYLVSKASGLVLDISNPFKAGSHLIMSKMKANSKTQIWRLNADGYIANDDGKLVVSSLNNSKQMEAQMIAGAPHKLTGQIFMKMPLDDNLTLIRHWCSLVTNVSIAPPQSPRPPEGQPVISSDAPSATSSRLWYRILSVPSKLAVAVKDNSNTSGTPVVTATTPNNNPNNLLWSFAGKTIRSKATGLVLDVKSPAGAGSEVVVAALVGGSVTQQWTLDPKTGYIRNGNGMVLAVSKSGKEAGVTLVVSPEAKTDTQQFVTAFVHDIK